LRENETGWRDLERYDAERVDPGCWMVSNWRKKCKRVDKFKEHCK